MTQKAMKQLEYTLATHEIENLHPSDHAIELCERMSEGKISADEAVTSILENYGIAAGKRR